MMSIRIHTDNWAWLEQMTARGFEKGRILNELIELKIKDEKN